MTRRLSSGEDHKDDAPESSRPTPRWGVEVVRGHWYLESFVDGQRTSRVPLMMFPFRVGRRSGIQLTLASDLVSKDHAEIVGDGDRLAVRDLGSTNGTFVNHERVDEAELVEGDILHFAHFEFRLVRGAVDDEGIEGVAERATKPVAELLLPAQLGHSGRQLKNLIDTGAVRVVFQRIVALPSGEIEAYEALGRGCHPELPEEPIELLRLAVGLGLERDLSRLFRLKTFDALSVHPGVRHFFLNIHPSELAAPELVESLRALQKAVPPVRLTLEVHESAVVDPVGIGALRSRLADIGVGLAYDDFGAGQARLLELAEVPPDYLKFDMRLVRGVDKAGPSRRKLLSSLVSVARELQVRTVAEGVETLSEAVVCAEIGFDFAQGFYFGRPTPLGEA
jgi:EAL domain-containing protein (putative c-di-GMP-specific phosphodiesterase class I)